MRPLALTLLVALAATAAPVTPGTDGAGPSVSPGGRSIARRTVQIAEPPPAPQAVRAGAGPVGSAVYPVPADTLVVSPTGSDAAAGTLTAPLRTVTAALRRVRPGGTITLRAGTYHESVLVPPGTPVTIQNQPGEAVWFDGARPLTGFARDGAAWSAQYDLRLDASPTYTRGAPDGTAANWRWVSAEHPMAAHPDQVWLDGVAQRQVGTRAELTPGAFVVDAGRLVLGSDPTGRTVEVGALTSAFSLRAPGTVLRGFGIRRYVPSVPDFGVVTAFFPRMTLEELTVVDGSTAGIGLYAPDSVVRATTVRGHGLIGIQGNKADRLTLDRVLVAGNNTEHFNRAPVAGGAKFARVRGLRVTDSVFEGNAATGLWLDESCYDAVIVRSRLTDNTGHGIMLELSAKAVVAGTTVLRSGEDALGIRNTSDVQVWNNTLDGSRRAVEISQDWRRPSNNTRSLDRRFPNDPAMTWEIADISLGNNVLLGGPKALMTVGVEDFDAKLDADTRRITLDGDLYAPPSATTPRWLLAWMRPGTDPYVATTLAQIRTRTGQERHGAARPGERVLDESGRLLPAYAALADEIAQPLPAAVADALGRPAGERRLGS